MSSIPDLWGDKINVNALTPAAILKTQSFLLSKKTRGIVRGEVEVLNLKDNFVSATFTITSEALGNSYTETIVRVIYKRFVVYPSIMQSSYFTPKTRQHPHFYTNLPDDLKQQVEPYDSEYFRVADEEAQYLALLSAIFSSQDLQNMVTSLIANSNESSQADENGEESLEG